MMMTEVLVTDLHACRWRRRVNILTMRHPDGPQGAEEQAWERQFIDWFLFLLIVLFCRFFIKESKPTGPADGLIYRFAH